MPRSVPARVLGAAVLLLAVGAPLALHYATTPDQGASAARMITICHRTESATAPWVFMTVDESTWPEHQAAGDIRASSLADCVQPPQQAQPAVAAAAQPAGQSQPDAPPTAQPQGQLTPAAPALSPTQPVVQPQSPAQAASEQGQQPAVGESVGVVAAGQPGPAPEVGVLPASGTPTADYTVTVLVLVALAGWGLYLRELGRRRT